MVFGATGGRAPIARRPSEPMVKAYKTPAAVSRVPNGCHAHVVTASQHALSGAIVISPRAHPRVRRRAVIRGHRRPCTRCAAVGAWRQITRVYETPVAILSMPVGCCARAVIVAQRELSGDVIFQRRAHAERAAARYDLSLPRRACDARSSGRGRREPWRVGCLSPRTACPMAAVSVPPPSLRRSRADVAIVASRSLECEASSSGPTAAAHLVRCGRGEKADGEGVRGAHRHPQHAHRLLCTCGHRPLAWAKRACRTASSRAREA